MSAVSSSPLFHPSPALSAKPNPTSSARSSSLPPSTVEYLKAWIMSPAHIAHPYPTDTEKADIMRMTGIEMKQLTNWFTNNRKRFWKPRITAMQESGTIPSIAAPFPASKQRPNSSPLSSSNPGRIEILSNLILPPSSSDVGVVVDFSSPSSSPSSSIVTPTSPSPMPMSSLTNLDSPKAGVTSHQDVVDPAGVVTRYEIVNVYVLQPTVGNLPTIKDVTILSPKASSYVLYSSLSHRICYTFHQSVSHDRKRVQSRRDAEVVRVKKKLLREYLRKGGGEIKGEGESKKIEGKESRGNKGTTRGKRANSEPTINLRRRPKTRNLTTRKTRTVSCSDNFEETYWSSVLQQEVSSMSGSGSVGHVGGMVLTSSDSDSTCSTEIDGEGEGGGTPERLEVGMGSIFRREEDSGVRHEDIKGEQTQWWDVSTPRAEIVEKGGWREVMGSTAVPWDRGEKELPTMEEAAVLFGFRKN